MDFDPIQGFRLLQQMIRNESPPATPEGICVQGLALIAKGLGASGGAIFLRQDEKEGGTLALLGTWGDSSRVETLGDEGTLAEDGRIAASDGLAEHLAIPLPGAGTGPAGVIIVDRPCSMSGSARAFAESAAEVLGSSLQALPGLRQNDAAGALLAQRNIELEILRELTEALSSQHSEEAALQVVLDLVLDKLGLQSGWIFWGESGQERLQLAASRGIAEDFVRQARENGVGSCLCKDVFATGRLRYARNTTDCPRLPELVCGTEPMTHACIPLKLEQGIMGVMNIANRPRQLFTPAELKFLETVGNHLCLAVDKLRTARAEHRRNAEARALASLAHAIGGSLDIERVLASVGDYARDLLSTDRCGIFLGSDPSDLFFAYLTGAPFEGIEVGGSVNFRELKARGIVQALSEKHTIVVQRSRDDPRINPELAQRWAMGAALLVPLVAHDQLQGLLLAGRAASSNWTDEEVAIADALGGHAAVAIENARLFRDAQDALMRIQHAQTGMLRAERLAAVGTLAASLAHEVRNPLNSIHLQLVLLSRRITRLDEHQREELHVILETAQREISRLDDLVEDFLSLSRVDSLSPSETDLEDVVRDVMVLMGPEAREGGVSVKNAFTGSLPPVLIDREKIKQALINLVRNSIEAMPDGGALTLTTRRNGTSVIVEVADTGQGVAPGVDVFDFFMTTKRGGTGLGLPIARRIVEAHGGSLTYESEPGIGTVFTVTMKIGSGD